MLGEINQGVEDAMADLRKRIQLVKVLEKEGEPQPRRVAMYYSSLERVLSHEDILPFVSMLRSIRKVENLDLIIHSPGGDGLAASSKHLSHGRMITAQGIQADLDLQHLKVKALSEADPYWIALHELLLRTDVVAKSHERGKVLFARDFLLSAN